MDSRSATALRRRFGRMTQVLLKTQSFAGNVLLTTGSNVLLALLTVLTGAMAARLLGPDGRGELAAIQMWPNFLAAIGNIGLPEALVYFCARSPANSGRYVGSAITLNLLVCAAFMAVGYVTVPLLLPAQSPEVIRAAHWYLLLLPVQALYLPQHAFRGLSDFASWNAMRFLVTLGWLGLLIFAAISAQHNPVFIALAYLAVLAVLALVILDRTRRRLPPPYRPDPRDWRPMLRFGLPSVTSGVPRMLNLRLDQMLMAALLPVPILGLYVVAVTWSNAVAPLPHALANVLFPETASKSDADARQQVFARGIRLAVLSAVSVAVAVAFLTPWMLPLIFGADFTAAVPAAIVLVLAAAIAAVNMVLEEGLRGLGAPALVLWSELAGLAVTVVSLLAMLKPWGIMGAAIASVLGYAGVLVALLAASRALTKCTPWTLLLPGRAEVEQVWRTSLRMLEKMFPKQNVAAAPE